ncbi:uncharacterized protein LOC131206994 [Anopheles bellator]|uniref:uncharacterized protein LOC131206994 n=1 Tax=Anopheles bellator TaxID=139047 RepID=UPI00264950C2|nr:uncharacterized protein LOC131206994 [Anopheles bellator]
MALLSFRLSIVFTIGLLLLNGFTSESSVLAFVNEEGPERLRLIAAPPAHVMVTTGSRSSPVYLPCQAELDLGASDGIPNSSSSYGDEYPNEHTDEDDEEDGEDGGYDDDFGGAEDDEEEDDEGDFLPHTAPLLNHNELVPNDERRRRPQPRDYHPADEPLSEKSPIDYADEQQDVEERRQQRRYRRKRYVRAPSRGFSGARSPGAGYYGASSFEYVWYRNDLEFLTTTFQNEHPGQTHKGFWLYENGTLRIPSYTRQNGNIVAGVYRCKASLASRYGRHPRQGTILSTETVVSIAYLERDNRIVFPNNTITSRPAVAIVLPCPFQSYPAANITWSLNKSVLPLYGNPGGTKENRYFVLQNGSLLISDLQLGDSGRYRCNATNNYVAKNVRSSSVNLLVMGTAIDTAASGQGESVVQRLLPPLQEPVQAVMAGDTLRLHCTCYEGCKPQWTFLPHQSQIPIVLENFTHQVTFVNVSVERHEGVFSCQTPDGVHRQLFNVTVLVAPTIVSHLPSYISSVVAAMALNCTVAGNPRPVVTWYKNGRKIRNNYIMQYSYPMLRIHTLDPEDEGLYQCVAKNAAGEIAGSAYLTIRDKQKYRHKAKRPDAIRCYPVDTTSLYLTFELASHMNTAVDYMMYYLAREDDPSGAGGWYSSPPTQLTANGSLRISGQVVEPFRRYSVFLRSCTFNDITGTETNDGLPPQQMVIVSRLSRAVQCASQGYPILYTFFPNNGIFIWWPRYSGVQPTAFTIHLRQNNGQANLTASFTNQIIGTVEPLDDYMTYDELEPLLGRIDAETGEFQDWLWDDNDAAESEEQQQQQQQQQQQASRRRRSHHHRSRSRRQSEEHRPAFDLSKDRKQIFDSLATSAVELDPETVEALRNNNGSGLAAASLGVVGRTETERNKTLRTGGPQQRITVTRFKVAGNVTGILLPNVRNVMVRVLGSIAPDGEPMEQDLRYVQWKMIDVAAPRTDAINRFQASHVDARSVQFTWSRFIATKLVNRCLQLCHKNAIHDALQRGSSHFDCQKIPKDATHYNVKDLLPLTLYKAFLKPCESKEALSEILEFTTKHDVPGPVTNHELHRKGGTITITWGPPANRNGILHGYIVEWVNEDSIQHTANLTADTASFTFPNVTSDERINISIRALSSSGIGIPIYLNLKQYFPDPDGDDRAGTSGGTTLSRHFQLLQFVLAAALFILFCLMAICCCLLLRRKACKKASGTGGAGSATATSLSTDAVGGSRTLHHHQPSSSDTATLQMMSMMMAAGCSSDVHEMQTLIRSSGNCGVPQPNGGVLLANGFGGAMYGNSTAPPSLPPVGVVGGGARQNPIAAFGSGVEPVPGTTTVPLNVTIARRSANHGYSPIATYKELLDRDHRLHGLPFSTTTEAKGNEFPTITALVAVDTPTFGTDVRIATNPQYLVSNGSSSTSTNQDSGRISTGTLAYTGDDHKRSPTLSFSSKSSCAVLTPSPSSSSSSSASRSEPPPTSPVPLDSSRRPLLDATLDSNTSTTYVEELLTHPQTAATPAAPPQPPPTTLELYDYEYATNCDDEKNRLTSSTDRKQQQKQVLTRADFRPVARLTEPIANELPPPPLERDVGGSTEACRTPAALTTRLHGGSDLAKDHHRPFTSTGEDGVKVSVCEGLRCYSLKSDTPVGNGADDDDDDDDGDDDDEDDEEDELDNSSSLLNTSSLSTKPLHQQNHTSSWNFRRPIIGPNG